MRRYRIAIRNEEEQDRGIHEIMLRGQVNCLPDDEFIVPEPALSVLDEMSVPYELIGEEGVDGVARSLRNPTTASL